MALQWVDITAATAYTDKLAYIRFADHTLNINGAYSASAANAARCFAATGGSTYRVSMKMDTRFRLCGAPNITAAKQTPTKWVYDPLDANDSTSQNGAVRTLELTIDAADNYFVVGCYSSGGTMTSAEILASIVLYEQQDVGPAMTSISVTPPTKTEYALSEALDTTGMSVTAYFEDGTSRALESSEYTLSGFASDAGGEKTVTVTAKASGLTAGFTVTVQSVVAGDGWSYDTETKTLTIESGFVWGSYDSLSNRPPWSAYEKTMTAVVLEEGVTSIGKYAFYGCEALHGVEIPEGVISVGNLAFCGCVSLTGVVIPEGVTSIGGSAFARCEVLQSVVIPEGVTSIGDSAFVSCTSLQSVAIPEGVTSIGDWAFASCTSLQSVAIPEGVTSIGDSTFYQCTSLQSVVIPEGVTSIGKQAFYACSSLQSVVIPEGVTSICRYAFYYCTALTSVVMPKSVTSIESLAFNTGNALKTVYFAGTQAQWNAITIASGNSSLSNAEKVFNYETETEPATGLSASGQYIMLWTAFFCPGGDGPASET